MDINKLFDHLDDWRHLPAYQLERRADIFFAIHLEEIMKKHKGVSIDLIIPEFPVRIGNIYPSKPELNSSFKIDYLVFSESANTVFLIELKTDQRSRRTKQDWYLEEANKIGVHGLVDGVLKINKATNQKVKYRFLLEKLSSVEWLVGDDFRINPKIESLQSDIIYIQPNNTEKLDHIISFDDIIKSLEEKTDEFSRRFIISLDRWKSDVNKA